MGRLRYAARLLAVLALVLTPLASHAEPQSTQALLAEAREALRREDGIAAEMKLRAALAQGMPRERVAALMGSAYLRQGDRQSAREWVAPGVFSPDTRAEGFRVLGWIEQQDRHLDAAMRAYDRALAAAPNDADLWIEIARLRDRRGEHTLALQAGDRAMAIDPRNVRALEFRGDVVRDRFGLLASLPWYESALAKAPGDVSVLIRHAATLGDLGRATEALVATRRLLQVKPGNPQAYYLQAVLAGRARRYDLARQLLARTRGKLDTLPGVMLVSAASELSAGNTQTAAELCERLLQRDPTNMPARQLLARALYLSEQYRYLTLRFADDIARGDASPYLLTIVARGFEAIGNRLQAGELLDRAALPAKAALRVVPKGSVVGALMAQGRSQEALAAAANDLAAHPGSYAAQSLAGDVQLATGRALAAQRRYAAAARIRMTDSLLQRRFEAFAGTGNLRAAAQMVQGYLLQNPANRVALRLQATLAVRAGDSPRAGAILDHLRRAGGDGDVQLLMDSALVQLNLGEDAAAQQAADQAYRMQRASPVAAQMLALSYATTGVKPGQVRSLLAKARQMIGDNPILAETTRRLGERRPA